MSDTPSEQGDKIDLIGTMRNEIDALREQLADCRTEHANKMANCAANAEHLRAKIAERDAEIAALKAERDTSVAVTERIKVALRIRGTGSYVEWAAYCRDALEKLERAEACEQWVHERLDRNMVVHPDHAYRYDKWA